MKPLSVCMPYWNRPTELARARASYDKLYPDMDLEFCICDDGSLMPLRDTQDPRERITRLPTKMGAKNPVVPLNKAIASATRDLIVLTNPEIEHRERVLPAMLEAYTGPNDYIMTGCKDVTSGRMYAGPGTTRAPLDGKQPIPPGTELHFCVLFHKSLWTRVGGFDEKYRDMPGCDDNDWLWSLWALGDVNFKYVDGLVYHYQTPHRWPGRLTDSASRLRSKWGHLEAFKCAS